MTEFKYDAVILAAGESKRMGFPKALLDSGDGRKFLERIISNVRNIEPPPENLVVVLGYHIEKITREIDLGGCLAITNESPELGQLSSLKRALENAGKETRGILLSLVDHPLVKSKTYGKIIEYARRNPGCIILPQFGERRGHPVFFPIEIFEDLVNCPLEQGARFAVRKNTDRMRILEVGDSGVLKDIDTPEQYRNAIEK